MTTDSSTGGKKPSRLQRRSGVLLHPTSLPGKFGIGDFGPSAYQFLDFLNRSGQRLWQVLPLGPTGYGNSPYQSPSAFAGNTLLISLDKLFEHGLLEQSVLSQLSFRQETLDFDSVMAHRYGIFLRAFDAFRRRASSRLKEEYDRFRQSNEAWLPDYALYRAIKEEHRGLAWTNWDPRIIAREAAALKEWRTKLQNRIEQEYFLQFEFAKQWQELRHYAAERSIQVIGDIPIFVAHDSADVWCNQSDYSLDPAGNPTVVAGVPPDYFSETGQLWGNPLYRWDRMRETGYEWWIARLRHSFSQYDLVRIDHFRGFEAYWEIPGDAPDARTGRWVLGPGAEMFEKAQAALGVLPVIAEDLGLITPEVEALRDGLGFPGMRVLQFGFGGTDGDNQFLPHNLVHNCIVYTGTHDNDTTVGWFHSEAGEETTRTADQIERERAFVMAYLRTDGKEIEWDMIRAAWSSVADTAIAPMQDLLSLGSPARMNLPGTSVGNWIWRLRDGYLSDALTDRLGELTALYGRAPDHLRPWYMGSRE